MQHLLGRAYWDAEQVRVALLSRMAEIRGHYATLSRTHPGSSDQRSGQGENRPGLAQPGFTPWPLLGIFTIAIMVAFVDAAVAGPRSRADRGRAILRRLPGLAGHDDRVRRDEGGWAQLSRPRPAASR
jgi:hypothetical protein